MEEKSLDAIVVALNSSCSTINNSVPGDHWPGDENALLNNLATKPCFKVLILPSFVPEGATTAIPAKS